MTEAAYSFSAEVIPFATTSPITYVWQATGQTPITYTQAASNTATFTWTSAGPKELLVSVTNGSGSFTDTHTIGIGGAVHQLYLPLVGRDM